MLKKIVVRFWGHQNFMLRFTLAYIFAILHQLHWVTLVLCWWDVSKFNTIIHTYLEMISPSSEKEKFSSPSLNSFPGD